jgi:Protein of unknown function (DUF2877)
VTRGALYLQTTEPPGALALLCRDAVRLPCGLLLPSASAELPPTSLAPPAPSSAGFLVGEHAVSWTGPTGPVVVRVAREWAPARPARGEVNAAAVAAVRAALGLDEPRPRERRLGHLDRCDFTVARATANSHSWPGDPLIAAVGDPGACVAAATGLLGRGPGLTPSGDDVLTGFLVGAAAFGVDAGALRHAIAVLAPVRTTALSAALLWHAARGECIDELAAVAAVLSGRSEQTEQTGRAVGRLLAVGDSSGAAMACGLVAAAETALQCRGGRAA